MEILYRRCAGLDVHKDSVVARIRCVSEPLHDEVRTFGTTTSELLELNEWLSFHGVDGGHWRLLETGVASLGRRF
jgi:transposase